MKFVTVLMTLALTAFSAAHATDDFDTSAQVAAKMVANAVVSQRLVGHEARKVLRLALQTGKASFGKMECEAALGSDACYIPVFVHDDESTAEAEETAYRLDVNVYQGKVTSAIWKLIAG